MYRRLKSLDLLVDTDVIGIQENDQIHDLSYNLQPMSLNRLFFPGKFVLLPVEQINSYKGCVDFLFRSFLPRFFSNPERRYNHVLGTTHLPQLKYIDKRRSERVLKLLILIFCKTCTVFPNTIICCFHYIRLTLNKYLSNSSDSLTC